MSHFTACLAILLLTAILASTPGYGQYTEVSRDIGSSTRVLDILPSGNDIVFAAFADGRLFRSTDTARTWTLIAERNKTEAIRRLATSAHGIIAGTLGGEILHSTDKGDSWTMLHRMQSGSEVVSIFTERDDILALGRDGTVASSSDGGGTWTERQSDHISTASALLRTGNGTLIAGSDCGGIFLSHDEGVSWEAPLVAPISSLVTDLAFSPHGCIMAATSDWGLFHSEDDGDTWEILENPDRGPRGGYRCITVWKDSLVMQLSSLYGGITMRDPHLLLRRALPAASPHEGVALCVLQDDHLLIGDGFGGLYRSCLPPIVQDSTDRIELVTDNSIPLLVPGEEFRQRLVLKRHHGFLQTAVAGEVIVWNSLTGEETVLSTDVTQLYRDTFSFVVPPMTSAGEYRLEYRPLHQRPATGRQQVTIQYFRVVDIPADQRAVMAFEAKPRQAVGLLHGSGCGTVYTAFWQGGLFRSDDGGNAWLSILPPDCPDSYISHLDGSPADGLLAVADVHDVYISDNNGTSWVRALNEIGRVHAIAAQGERRLVAADSGLYYSSDRGVSWRCITPISGVKHTHVFLPGGDTLAVHYEYGILLSPDAGTNWELISYSERSTVARGLLLDLRHGILISSRGILRLNCDVSTDWENIDQKYMHIGKLTHLTAGSEDHIFAAYTGEASIFHSDDFGRTWSKLPGIPDSLELLTALCVAGETLFLGTNDGQVFARRLSTDVSQIVTPAQAAQVQIASMYPNPCTDRIHILVRSESARNARIAIHDLSGRRVAVIHDGLLRGGSDMFAFDVSRLPSGRYHAVIETHMEIARGGFTVLR